MEHSEEKFTRFRNDVAAWESMSIEEMACVYDAASASIEAIQGILNLPRCAIDGKAYEWIEGHLDHDLEFIRSEIVDLMKARKPKTEFENEQRSRVILRYQLECDYSPTQMVIEASKLIDEKSFQVSLSSAA